jgi:hypothetical protein
MFQRMLAATAVYFVLSSAAVSAEAPRACSASPKVDYELIVVAGAVGKAERDRIVVRVHGDGCVVVRRPWFQHQPGEYELRLTATERDALHQTMDVDALRALRQDTLLVQAAARRSDESQVHDLVADADLHVLYWRDGEERRQLALDDALDAARRQPQAADVNRFARAVRALQALAQRDGKRMDAENAP